MTGIERLRGIGTDYVEHSWSEAGKSRGMLMLDIADQIEREHEGDLTQYHVPWSKVQDVMLDMERHVLGHEGMEDSPVARWARELRDALKSDASDADEQQSPSCADPDGAADVTSEAPKVTRDPAEDVSMSAYDLLPEAEREAIAWVREHGGLSHVKDIYHDFRAVVECLGIEWSESELHGLMYALDRRLMTVDALRAAIEETCTRLGVEHTGDLTQDAQAIWREIGALGSRLKESVPRAAYERHLARLQRQIDESHAALRRRNARVAELETERDKLRRQRSEAVSAQLASDAALYDLRREVRDQCQAFGVDVSGCEIASEMLHDMNEALSFRLMPEGMEWPRYESGEPVGFGDEVSRLGEVFAICLYCDGSFSLNFRSYQKGERVKRPAKVLDADGVEIRVGDTVYHVKDGSEMTVYGIEGEWLVVSVGGRVRHDVVTHRAPVLAADGKPLREGETVWNETGISFKVTAINPKNNSFEAIRDLDGSKCYLNPRVFSHERPDSWERLWDDIEECAVGYESFMRRAKALAGDA